jgi:GT2 family glycosyltransferase
MPVTYCHFRLISWKSLAYSHSDGAVILSSMHSHAKSDQEDALTISVVLFLSPLDQLKALIDSIIVALAAADLRGATCVLVDHSCDQYYSDECRNMLAGYSNSAELHVRLIVRDENDGYGAGHNVAMAGLQGKLHLILNPDVELARDAISLALETMLSDESVALLAPVGFDAMGDPEFLAKAYPSVWVLALRSLAPAWLRSLGAEAMARYELRDQPAQGLRPITLASGCCMWVRREVFDAVDGFNEASFL